MNEKIANYLKQIFSKPNLEFEKVFFIANVSLELGASEEQVKRVIETFKHADIVEEKNGIYYTEKKLPEVKNPGLTKEIEDELKSAGL